MRITRFNAATAAVAAVVLSGCMGDSTTGPLMPRAAPTGVNRAIIPTALPGVVVAGADAGNFFNPTAPAELTRVTGAFWDNVSSDDADWGAGPAPAAGHKVKCNVGFYAVADVNFGSCLEMNAPSLANIGGFAGGNYWGDNGGIGGGKDPSSFLFSGQYSYNVTLVGTFAGGISEVGWFTKVGSTYTFHAVGGFGSKTVNTSVTINTNTLAAPETGANWGFYVTNTSLDATGGCRANTACSDATGGFASGPFQQFAMFINSGGTKLEVGLEDNNLIPLWTGTGQAGNSTNRDSDYNDYIFTIVPSVIPKPICDFITFGRLVTQVGDDKIVISGNAGGNAPGGGILGTIEISVGGTQYHVPTIESYGPTTSGVLFPDEFARVITGHSGSHLVELRLRDNPNPGHGEPGTTEGDKVWLKIDNTVVVPLQTLDKGNIQLHLNCRGPGD